MRPEVGIVDYTGGNEFGDWIETNIRHAQVYTEKAGINTVIIDGCEDLKADDRKPGILVEPVFGSDVHNPPEHLHPRRWNRNT